MKSDDGQRMGILSACEIEELRAAYSGGAQGGVLIGLRQDKRVLTLLLPPQRNSEAMMAVVSRNAERLRRLGSDGFVHVRRARIRAFDKPAKEAMLIHELKRSENRHRLALLGPAATGVITLKRPVGDQIARLLAGIICAEQVE